MPFTVNIHAAKTQLSKLLKRVQNGEEIIIAKAGKPIARLLPAERPRPPRVPGTGKDQIIFMAEDFDAPLPDDILKLFYGEDEKCDP